MAKNLQAVYDGVWQNFRQKSTPIIGYSRCTYACIYLLDSNGVYENVWSFNVGQDVPLLYDDPTFERNWRHKDNIFRLQASEKIGKFIIDDASTMHIGRLTQDAVKIIVDNTHGRGELIQRLTDSKGYVFYRPRQYYWEELVEKPDTGETGKSSKFSWLTLAAIALSSLSN